MGGMDFEGFSTDGSGGVHMDIDPNDIFKMFMGGEGGFGGFSMGGNMGGMGGRGRDPFADFGGDDGIFRMFTSGSGG